MSKLSFKLISGSDSNTLESFWQMSSASQNAKFLNLFGISPYQESQKKQIARVVQRAINSYADIRNVKITQTFNPSLF